jgi:DNA-binding response OmpR family regulator
MMPDTTDKKKILIVDDDEISLKFAEIILQNDYEVVTAKSGKIALDYLEHFRYGFVPDVILLDIVMPHMDGWETFNKIKAVSQMKNVPVIFITSVKKIEGHKRAIDMGAADYIVKPYNREVLLTRIDEALKSKT